MSATNLPYLDETKFDHIGIYFPDLNVKPSKYHHGSDKEFHDEGKALAAAALDEVFTVSESKGKKSYAISWLPVVGWALRRDIPLPRPVLEDFKKVLLDERVFLEKVEYGHDMDVSSMLGADIGLHVPWSDREGRLQANINEVGMASKMIKTIDDGEGEELTKTK
jgi:hypothetical protein